MIKNSNKVLPIPSNSGNTKNRKPPLSPQKSEDGSSIQSSGDEDHSSSSESKDDVSGEFKRAAITIDANAPKKETFTDKLELAKVASDDQK